MHKRFIKQLRKTPFRELVQLVCQQAIEREISQSSLQQLIEEEYENKTMPKMPTSETGESISSILRNM
jgi:hypothetical protein